METSTRKVTREEFVLAINTAEQVVKELHPRSRLAYYCGVFTEKNKYLVKAHDKESKAVTRKIILDSNTFKADNATEKDGVLLKDDKGEYLFSKEAAKKIISHNENTSILIADAIDEFLKDEIEVTCILTTFVLKSKEGQKQFELPETVTDNVIKALNNFVFKYKNEFEEEI